MLMFYFVYNTLKYRNIKLKTTYNYTNIIIQTYLEKIN
jgi:hypothetical protein